MDCVEIPLGASFEGMNTKSFAIGDVGGVVKIIRPSNIGTMLKTVIENTCLLVIDLSEVSSSEIRTAFRRMSTH